MIRDREVVYSVTLRVDATVAADWLAWMRDVHIPEVMATGCFEAFEMRRFLGPAETADPVYEVRYLCQSMEQYRRYQETYAAELQAKHATRYAGRVEASRKLFGSLETRS